MRAATKKFASKRRTRWRFVERKSGWVIAESFGPEDKKKRRDAEKFDGLALRFTSDQ